MNYFVTTADPSLFEKGQMLAFGNGEWTVTDVETLRTFHVRDPYWWERLWFRLLSWMDRWDRRLEGRYI